MGTDISGTGENGVYLLGEYPSEKDVLSGRIYSGSTAFTLRQLLERMQLQVQDFWFDAGLPQPPLYGSVSQEELDGCQSDLDESLGKAQPKVVVALGEIPLRRLHGLAESDCILEHRTKGRAGYVEWSSRYSCWVIGTWSPTYIIRGNWYLLPAWRAHVNLALQIASHGFSHRPPTAIVDPLAGDFADWLQPYLASSESLMLATDMETPHKRGAAEDELDLGDPSYQINRVSYSFWPGEGISFPFSVEYVDAMKRAHSTSGRKLIWNRAYDEPRFDKNGLKLHGPVWDSMALWHAVQTRLPKAINFVAPLVIPHYPRWKHLGDENEGLYSCYDSSGLHDITTELIPIAQSMGVFDYFLTQYHECTDALNEMEAPGVPIDQATRLKVATELSEKQARLQTEMEQIIPEKLRKYDPKQGYVRDPDDTTGMVRITAQGKVKVCAACGANGVNKSNHTARKSLSGRGKTAVPNPCHGAEIHELVQTVTRWARVDPFVPSNVRMQEYQSHRRHEPVLGEKKRPTYDAKALERLVKKYPDDALYPKILEYRGAEKLQTYTGSVVTLEDGTVKLSGGWQTDANGYIHPHFSHNPNTGRLSCVAPNLQNIPRAEDDDSEAKVIKMLFVPEPGCVIVEVDFASIEALLLGYFARDPFYMRLATLGIHDFVNARVLREQGRITDEPTPAWSDADLAACFKDLKKRFPVERTAIKKIVYTSNYGGGAYKIFMDDPKVFGGSRKFAEELQRGYFATFPSIKRYQDETIDEAHRNGYLRGVWGLINRFEKVIRWEKDSEGKWRKKLGDEANEALAFKPQHAGSGIMKRAMTELRRRDPEVFRTLRLTIHDSIFSSAVPVHLVDDYVPRMVQIMSEPAPCMPMPAAWGMGAHLRVGVEAKISPKNWAESETWKPGMFSLQEAA